MKTLAFDDDEFNSTKDCNFSKIIKDSTIYSHQYFYFCYCDEKTVMICESCKEQCHKDHAFYDVRFHSNYFVCECRLQNHEWKNINMFQNLTDCIYSKIENYSPSKYSYYYIENENKIYLCKICSKECNQNKEIFQEEKLNGETTICSCTKHIIFLNCSNSLSIENFLNFDYNLLMKNDKLKDIYITPFSKFPPDFRSMRTIIKFNQEYQFFKKRKFFIPKFMNDFTYEKVRDLFKQPIELCSYVSEFVYCLFSSKIKSFFISSWYSLNMESIINMNSKQRLFYLQSWRDQKPALLIKLDEFFQDYFDYIESFFKDEDSDILEFFKSQVKIFQMIKSLVKYNIIRTPYQFLAIIEAYLNEAFEYNQDDFKKIEKEWENILVLLIKICMYRLLNIYDNFINEDKNNFTSEIVMITRVFFTCVNLINLDYLNSFPAPKVKYCIATTYNLLYESDVSYNFGCYDYDHSNDIRTNIDIYYKILSEENLKYFNHEIDYKQYISNIDTLFTEISQDYGSASSENAESTYNINFTEKTNFYQKFNEFLYIYSEIINYFKDIEIEMLDEYKLQQVCEYVIGTISENNICLFLNIDLRCFIKIHGCNIRYFSYFFVENFFQKVYLKYSANIKSLYFLTEFFSTLIEIINNQSENELEDDIIIAENTSIVSRFLYFLTELIEKRGDFFKEMVSIRNHVLQSTHKLISDKRILQISVEGYKKYIKSKEISEEFEDFLKNYLKLSNQYILSGLTYMEVPSIGLLFGGVIIDLYESNIFDKNSNLLLEIEILRNINLYYLFKEYKISNNLRETFKNHKSLQNFVESINTSIFDEKIENEKSNEDDDDYIEKLYEFQIGILKIMNKTNKKFTKIINDNQINYEDKIKNLLEYIEVSCLQPLNMINIIMKKSKNLNNPDIYQKVYYPLRNSVRNILSFYEMKLDIKEISFRFNARLTAEEKDTLKNFLLYESCYYEMNKIINHINNILNIIYDVKISEYQKLIILSSSYRFMDYNEKNDKKAKEYIALNSSYFKINSTTDYNKLSIRFCLRGFFHNKIGSFPIYHMNLENIFNIEYLYYLNNLMKRDETMNNEIYDEIINYNFKMFLKFIIFIYMYGIFNFIIYRRIYLKIYDEDYLFKIYSFALNFLRLYDYPWDENHEQIFDTKFSFNKNEELMDFCILWKNKYEYRFIDVLFSIKEITSKLILEENSNYKFQLMHIYELSNSFIIQLVGLSNPEQINYINISSCYDFLNEIISLREFISNQPFENLLEETLLSVTYSTFLFLNSLLNSEMDNFYIIIHIEMIFQPSYVIKLLSKCYLILLKKYLNLEIKELTDLKGKMCKEFKLEYFKRNQIYDDKVFQLSCLFFIYLKIFQIKYENKDCEKFFNYNYDNSEYTEYEELKLTYSNKELEKKLKRIKGINDKEFQQILKGSKYLVSNYSDFVISCEFVFKKEKKENEIEDQNENDYEYIPRSIYFVQDPRFSTLDKKKILIKVFNRGTEKLRDRLTLLFEDTQEYIREISIKSDFIYEGKFNKKILEINYSLVNMINLIYTTMVILLLLIFLNINNRESSTIYSFIFYSQIIQMLFNLVFIGLYSYSKYRILINLDNRVESIENKSIYDYFDIYFLNSFIYNDDVTFLIINVIFELILFFNSSLISLLCLQLLTIIKFVPTIRDIFTAFAMKFDQLIGMILFLAIIIYIYANFAFLLIKNEYLLDVEGGEQQNVCEDLISCFIFHFDTGVRSGGGIGDSLNLESLNNLYDYIIRYIGDLTFFICVILLVLNMINGIIITTFSQLREDNEKLHEGLDNKCYICGRSKDDFEKNKENFSLHLKETHNYINYIKFFCYLKNKPIYEYSKDEDQIYECQNKKDVTCFPIFEESKRN